MKKLKNDNRGAALVSVMIAVTFMIILASSLLYMAYMNYLTKSMRYSATDNFYTDEFALDELTTAIQQVAASSSSVSAAKTNLESRLGVHTNANGKKVYTGASLAALIVVASQDATITVDTTVPKDSSDVELEDNYIIEGNSIRLKGVRLTAKDASGYVSVISTDIILTFPGTTPGDMDINDFSLIVDTPVQCEAGDLVIGGCIYLHAPGRKALTVSQSASVQLLSDKGIINGDIEVNGILSITGEIWVNGKIYVNSNGVLLCTGNLHHEGIVVSGSGKVVGLNSSNNYGATNVDESNGLPGDGLTPRLFNSVYLVREGATTFNAGKVEITFEEFLRQSNNNSWLKFDNGISDFNNPGHVGAFIGLQNTINNEAVNTLIMTVGSCEVKGEVRNSTVMCDGYRDSAGNLTGTPGVVIFREVSMPTYLGCMSDDTFEEAKNIMVNVSERTINSSYGTYKFFFQGGMASTIPGSPDDTFADPSDTNSENGIRNFVFHSGRNYLPVGHFIVENSSEVISEVFSQLATPSDPTKTYIMYENWNKE